MAATHRLVRVAALALLLASLRNPESARAQSQDPSAARERFDRFVGVWKVVVREPRRDGSWESAPATVVEAATVLRDRFVVLEGFYALPGHDRPLGMVFLLSQDPFQDVVRVTALDDFVGLLDGYAGSWQGERLVVSNLQCDTPFQGHHGRLTFLPGEAGGFEIQVEVSADRGASWRTTQVASFVRQ